MGISLPIAWPMARASGNSMTRRHTGSSSLAMFGTWAWGRTNRQVVVDRGVVLHDTPLFRCKTLPGGALLLGCWARWASQPARTCQGYNSRAGNSLRLPCVHTGLETRYRAFLVSACEHAGRRTATGKGPTRPIMNVLCALCVGGGPFQRCNDIEASEGGRPLVLSGSMTTGWGGHGRGPLDMVRPAPGAAKAISGIGDALALLSWSVVMGRASPAI